MKRILLPLLLILFILTGCAQKMDGDIYEFGGINTWTGEVVTE